MLVGSQSLGATLVLVVPDAQRLVVSAAHNELATGVEHHATHPVVMANLRQEEGVSKEVRARDMDSGASKHMWRYS